MKTIRTLFPMLGVLAVLAGCSGESSTASGAESASTAQAKSTVATPAGDKAGAGRPHMMHGPGGLLFAALHEDIGLSADQKAKIQALVDASRPAAPPAPDTSRTTALASAIRAGKVDAATVQPPEGTMEAKRKEHEAKLASSLATLHDTLTKEQRSALVDAVKAKAKDHGPGRGGPEKEGHARGPHGPHGGPDGFGPMHLLEGIDLTDAQRAEIKSKLEAARPAPPTDADKEAMKARFEAMKKDMDAKLESFKADAFDANAFLARPADAPQMEKGHADHMAKELSIIVSVLDASQREKLAQKIEQGPPARPARPAAPAGQ